MDVIKPYNEPVFPSMQGFAVAAEAGEGELGPTRMRMMNIRRNALQKAYLDRWNASATSDGKPPIDGIIQAVSPWAAPRLSETQRSGLYVGYTGVWNFLGEYIPKPLLPPPGPSKKPNRSFLRLLDLPVPPPD